MLNEKKGPSLVTQFTGIAVCAMVLKALLTNPWHILGSGSGYIT